MATVGTVEGDLQRRLGRNLRALRLAKGLSQEAFADLLGIHRTYIGGLERGERNVTLRTVERIADRLGDEAARLLHDEPR
ncbi:MAG TPA: helix-turn-helix transcriptional regulator [Acidimicrobiales bacterium]|nr:helix-turn-helix transcriptional regulator [Acidimicrobiales bacterium]